MSFPHLHLLYIFIFSIKIYKENEGKTTSGEPFGFKAQSATCFKSMNTINE